MNKKLEDAKWYIITEALEIIEKCRIKMYARIQAKKLSKDYYPDLQVVRIGEYLALKEEQVLLPKKETKVLPPLGEY
jgi:hypothetical protein